MTYRKVSLWLLIVGGIVTICASLVIATCQNSALRNELRLVQQRALLAEDSARRKQVNIDLLMRQLDVAIRERNHLREVVEGMKP